MDKVNYQVMLDEIIRDIPDKETPRLLMHSCCAPCSSYCLSYLAEYFSITVLYYNPNISPEDEYYKRIKEQARLVDVLPVKNKISFAEGEYEPLEFFKMAEGMEDMPEGGARCFKCYEMRQRKAAEYALAHGFDYFTTTLSVSPHKNAQVLNETGLRLEKEYGVKYLVSDFKKKGGYQKSIQYSREYNLYRQDYCGCIFSKREREQEKTARILEQH
ncbi:MAG: epoxyqueuosine reductase QueH [Lachnospiraceae bacterium]|nr:epoxyqueuosine reductase QueH [Lachnospiraceae bacterium]